MSPITPLLLGAGVDGAADTLLQAQEPKMGYHLGSQDLVCHLSGLPSLHPANLTSETQFICYGEANQKLMLPPVHFLPPQLGFFVKL